MYYFESYRSNQTMNKLYLDVNIFFYNSSSMVIILIRKIGKNTEENWILNYKPLSFQKLYRVWKEVFRTQRLLDWSFCRNTLSVSWCTPLTFPTPLIYSLNSSHRSVASVTALILFMPFMEHFINTCICVGVTIWYKLLSWKQRVLL